MSPMFWVVADDGVDDAAVFVAAADVVLTGVEATGVISGIITGAVVEIVELPLQKKYALSLHDFATLSCAPVNIEHFSPVNNYLTD